MGRKDLSTITNTSPMHSVTMKMVMTVSQSSSQTLIGNTLSTPPLPHQQSHPTSTSSSQTTLAQMHSQQSQMTKIPSC